MFYRNTVLPLGKSNSEWHSAQVSLRSKSMKPGCRRLNQVVYQGMNLSGSTQATANKFRFEFNQFSHSQVDNACDLQINVTVDRQWLSPLNHLDFQVPLLKLIQQWQGRGTLATAWCKSMLFSISRYPESMVLRMTVQVRPVRAGQHWRIQEHKILLLQSSLISIDIIPTVIVGKMFNRWS